VEEIGRVVNERGHSISYNHFQDSNDKCGTAIAHAVELGKRVDEILRDSQNYRQINIFGHSKGGIDARIYLANCTQSIANLIMIGTPISVTPIAERASLCAPAVWDVLPEAAATKAGMNPNTKYYTIAGDWEKNIGGNPMIPGPDDGLMPVSSAESEGYFLTHFATCTCPPSICTLD
jgi:alpha-beta hydrolase superfamily lysophospholipase